MALRDVTKKNVDGVGIAFIEQRVAPHQLVVANAERRPAGQPAMLANGNHEVARLPELQVPPANVCGIPTHQKVVCRRDAAEECIELGASLAKQLEPVTGDPSSQAAGR